MTTDGAFVVWSELVQPNRQLRYANLYAADLASGRVSILGEQLEQNHYWSYQAPGFALDAGTAVWIDQPMAQGYRGLMAQNLRTGERTLLTSARASYPAVAGSLISWWEVETTGGATPTTRARLFSHDLSASLAPRELATVEFGGEAYLLRGGEMSAEQVIFL